MDMSKSSFHPSHLQTDMSKLSFQHIHPKMDSYRDKILKYPLTNQEYEILDKVWEFIDIFNKNYILVSEYKNYLINTFGKYSPEEFMLLESIANKLFWNLRWLLFPLWITPDMSENDYDKFIKNNYNKINELPYSLLLCKCEKYTNTQDLENKLTNHEIFNTTYYRSFINKIIMIDKSNKTIITKEFEGSSNIFSKNYFNLLTIFILFNRKIYEAVMKDTYNFKNHKITLPEFYFQYDFGFPNLNFCTYSFGTEKDRLDRIKKFYYSNYKWTKLIK